ncbi:MAG: hypothetical protein ABFC84_16770 [Veillonellales bacterium]
MKISTLVLFFVYIYIFNPLVYADNDNCANYISFPEYKVGVEALNTISCSYRRCVEYGLFGCKSLDDKIYEHFTVLLKIEKIENGNALVGLKEILSGNKACYAELRDNFPRLVELPKTKSVYGIINTPLTPQEFLKEKEKTKEKQ